MHAIIRASGFEYANIAVKRSSPIANMPVGDTLLGSTFLRRR
jgi:hypothetical protein